MSLARHFRLLRRAILYGYAIERRHGGGYAVSSRTHGHTYFWLLSADGPCPCPSLKSCIHVALVFDREHTGETAYESARLDDRLAMRLRQLQGTGSKDDAAYFRYAERVSRARIEALMDMDIREAA